MITNLFSIFDPSTLNFRSSNWLSSLLPFLLIPIIFWFNHNRGAIINQNLLFYLFNEFSPLLKSHKLTLLLPLTFFFFIAFNNLIGLLPYVFTASSHLIFTMSLALPTWLAIVTYGWLNNTSNLLVHLIPQGTPTVLIPFIVLIETVSNLIRPGTLAIRLTANIIAGHLLIVLLRSASPITSIIFYPLLLLPQVALATLELAVAFIQAYVFTVLTTLYITETTD